MHLLNPSRQLVLALPCLSPLADARCAPSNDCKAYPGSKAWPSPGTWKSLNDTLHGRLLNPIPPGAVCHPGQHTYNVNTCSQVAKDWGTYDFHSNNPVSVMWDQFANYTCLPDSKDPCSAEGYPAYVVNATTPAHVKAGVDFARKHNVRLNIKSSGHDFLGRSNAPGSLSIWVHHLNSIQYHADRFKLAGSGKILTGNAITVGGGTQMYDIYKASGAHNQTVVGGGAKTVSVGGYVTGGGHSILAPRFGLAADNVLQMEIVTPGGAIITINEDQHSDLFWAMRGGGGSTFGVITSVTLKTHKSPKIQQVAWVFTAKTPDSPIVYDLMTYVASKFPYLMNAGLSGYTLLTPSSPSPIPLPGMPAEIAGVMGLSILQSDAIQDPAIVDNIFNPVNETIQERWKGEAQFFKLTVPYDSFLSWFNANYDQGSAGNSTYLVSRLLDYKSLTADPKSLGNALKSAFENSGGMGAYMVAGKGVQEAKPRGGGNSVNPAWRKAYIHSLTGKGFPPFNKTAEEEAKKGLDASFEPLRKLTPTSGAYINEAFPFEKDWQHTFWGDHYERLLQIKRNVDPNDVLWCSPCVGNERWMEKQNGQLCKIN